jgi:hypothetical protein
MVVITGIAPVTSMTAINIEGAVRELVAVHVRYGRKPKAR